MLAQYAFKSAFSFWNIWILFFPPLSSGPFLSLSLSLSLSLLKLNWKQTLHALEMCHQTMSSFSYLVAVMNKISVSGLHVYVKLLLWRHLYVSLG